MLLYHFLQFSVVILPQLFDITRCGLVSTQGDSCIARN